MWSKLFVPVCFSYYVASKVVVLIWYRMLYKFDRQDELVEHQIKDTYFHMPVIECLDTNQVFFHQSQQLSVIVVKFLFDQRSLKKDTVDRD